MKIHLKKAGGHSLARISIGSTSAEIEWADALRITATPIALFEGEKRFEAISLDIQRIGEYAGETGALSLLFRGGDLVQVSADADATATINVGAGEAVVRFSEKDEEGNFIPAGEIRIVGGGGTLEVDIPGVGSATFEVA